MTKLKTNKVKDLNLPYIKDPVNPIIQHFSVVLFKKNEERDGQI